MKTEAIVGIETASQLSAVTGKYTSTRFDEPLQYTEGRHPGVEDIEEFKANTWAQH